MNTIIKRSLWNALGTVAYVTLVATFMQNTPKLFGGKPDTIFAPIFILTLFVLSATITGSLVLGKPILMYLDNEKAGAVKMFICTVGWLALATVILLVANIVF